MYALLSVPIVASAQWQLNGNPGVVNADYLGSRNDKPLVFKVFSNTNTTPVASFGNSTTSYLFTVNSPITANNTLAVTGLSTLVGGLKITSFTGTGFRVLQTDNTGNITLVPAGTNAQYLDGVGAWRNFPTTPTPYFVAGSTATATNTTYNVGINTPNPTEKLDVTGNIKASGTITGSTGLAAGNLVGTGARLLQASATGSINTLAMGTSTQYLNGVGQWQTLPSSYFTLLNATTITTAYNLSVGGTSPLISATVNANLLATHQSGVAINALASTVAGATALQTFTTSNQYVIANSLTYTPPKGGSTVTTQNFTVNSAGEVDATNYFINGQPLVKPQLWDYLYGANGYPYLSNLNGIGITLGRPLGDPSNALRTFVIQNTAHATLPLGNYNSTMLMDFEGQNPTLIFKDSPNATNTSQEADLLIGAADGAARFVTNDGFVFFMNANNKPPTIRPKNFKIMAYDSYFSGTQKEVLDLTSTGALTLNADADNTPALTLYNNAIQHAAFKVMGNGRTEIGTKTQNTGATHADALLTVYGKVVAKSCFVSTTGWSDFVFDANYALPNLYEVEKYYTAHKHLPQIPSEAEVMRNGIDVAEMNKLLLMKIEEMTMLMVQQQKQIDALNAKVK